MQSFKPYPKATVNQVLDGNSNRVALPRPVITGDSVKVLVSGTAVAFICPGNASVDASTTTDMPQMANSVETYALEEDDTHVAIHGLAGSTVYITMGTGL